MQRFWNWDMRKVTCEEPGDDSVERILSLRGPIAEDSWFDDDVTPEIFRNELESGSGPVTVWINSPGGDCFAAAEIYNMLREYKDEVTVKIDGVAASAASVIAMAGNKVLVSPVSMIMIHNPATIAFGDHTDMEKAAAMLGEIKESIINAYYAKTHLSREQLSDLMEKETWMDANKAVELGFADGMMGDEGEAENPASDGMMFSNQSYIRAVTNKVGSHFYIEDVKTKLEIQEEEDVVESSFFYDRLRELKEKF